MELLITGAQMASCYHPEKPTYAIRIFSRSDPVKAPLQQSPLFKHVAEYAFDDVTPTFGIPGTTLCTPDIADAILTDFIERRSGCEVLLVHCGKGKNRSPAVGIALNDIFKLGEDSLRLKNVYPEANWYVYELLKLRAEARELKP